MTTVREDTMSKIAGYINKKSGGPHNGYPPDLQTIVYFTPKQKQ